MVFVGAKALLIGVNLKPNPLLKGRSKPFSFPRSAWECILGGLLTLEAEPPRTALLGRA